MATAEISHPKVANSTEPKFQFTRNQDTLEYAMGIPSQGGPGAGYTDRRISNKRPRFAHYRPPVAKSPQPGLPSRRSARITDCKTIRIAIERPMEPVICRKLQQDTRIGEDPG